MLHHPAREFPLDAHASGGAKKHRKIFLSKRPQRFLVHTGVAEDLYLPRAMRVKGEFVINL